MNNQEAARQVLFSELKEMADYCSYGQLKFVAKVDSILSRLSELQKPSQAVADLELKGQIFAEWCSPFHFSVGINKWFGNKELKSTSELYNSPEFEAYYQERIKA